MSVSVKIVLLRKKVKDKALLKKLKIKLETLEAGKVKISYRKKRVIEITINSNLPRWTRSILSEFLEKNKEKDSYIIDTLKRMYNEMEAYLLAV